MYPIFLQSFAEPSGQKKKNFSKMHESFRKIVERCFGVLKIKFQILSRPMMSWDKEFIRCIFEACIILHNIIREYIRTEKGSDIDEAELERIYQNASNCSEDLEHKEFVREYKRRSLCQKLKALNDVHAYNRLRYNVVEHLWNLKGNSNEI
jgi:hypothetical protein